MANDKDDSKVRVTSTQTEVLSDSSELAKSIQDKSLEPALIVIQGENLGRVHRLRPGRNLVGRSSSAQILVEHRAASGSHAELRVDDAGIVVLEDLQSTNGTFVNGKRVQAPVPLKANDQVKVGNVVFKFVESRMETDFAENLHHKSTRDPMTGVYNKEYLLNQAASAVSTAKQGFPLALIMMDLDHFKKVNDTFGHVAGDYVLIETSRLIREGGVLRSGEIVGRYGGEEFMILLPDTKLEEAGKIAERIRAIIQHHDYVFEGKRIPVTSSLGVAAWRPVHATAEALIQEADALLYESKRGGRNRVTIAK